MVAIAGVGFYKQDDVGDGEECVCSEKPKEFAAVTCASFVWLKDIDGKRHPDRRNCGSLENMKENCAFY